MLVPAASPQLWNSLEVTKLAASILTPVVVAILGILILRITKRIESREWINQKVIEKRLSAYDELAPQLNDVLCYFTYIGNWKERTPLEIVLLKRDMDRRAHVVAPLFSPAFIDSYDQFVHCCYQTYTGWGSDAKLRTDPVRRRDAFGREWRSEWDAYFSNNPCDPMTIRAAYQKLMSTFGVEFGLDFQSPVPAGTPPANWKPLRKTARVGD
jgi:hypothetical protein